MTNVVQIAFGVLWFMSGLGVLVKIVQADWLTTMAEMFSSDTFTLVVFWVATLVMILIINFGLPIYIVMDAMRETDDGL